MPYDTTRDEYKIFACIESLTPAERDLGARVAKAAQRLKTWCAEIEQWGWTGSFEQPSEEYREQRRRSLELRIREHVKDAGAMDNIGPLEYWGSLLSVEVEAHESRIDEIGDELLTLDIEELKEHVLDIHGPNRSRPSSAGLEMTRQHYTPMDDFSFLITQTLLAALPNHFQLKDRLSTWTARVSVLRDAPRYLADLRTSQKAMRLAWDAVEPPSDPSDAAFDKWKDAIDTISGVLQGKVSHLGQRLDRMLDVLEGHEDHLPEDWIDIFEGVETDFGRWAHESRKRVMEIDMRRKVEQNRGVEAKPRATSESLIAHFNHGGACTPQPEERVPTSNELRPAIHMKDTKGITDMKDVEIVKDVKEPGDTKDVKDVEDLGDVEVANHAKGVKAVEVAKRTEDVKGVDGVTESEVVKDMEDINNIDDIQILKDGKDLDFANIAPRSVTAFETSIPEAQTRLAESAIGDVPQELDFDPHTPAEDDSIFEEGDTVVHNETEDIPSSTSDIVHILPHSTNFSDSSIIITTEDRPQTPRSRRGSVDSISSNISFSSSPPSVMEESPSVRNTTNRQSKAPRPALNAAMGKRRAPKRGKELSVGDAPPWPPTQFSKPSSNSAEDLERKISDILTTIPAHIRLTSGVGADAREVKPGRGITSKGSRQYLRAARSMSGMKSPELTLSPARQDFDSANAASGRKSAAAMRGDNDIKLYHLTQPGKEHPIKLFIRRVGENGERVMVRVGGGWADLGEYLRQYAEHHGRRAVSDGKFEILGLEVPEMSPGRPESAMGRRDRTFSGAGPQTGSPNTTPQKPPGIGMLKDDAAPPLPSLTTTPAGMTGDASAPSTGSSRVSWTGNEVGLAGPKAKKLDLSGEKLEWIEGMMKQARTVSSGNMTSTPRPEHVPTHVNNNPERAESRSESRTGARKTDFGVLGKVGGTKRIFMRGGALSEH